MRPTLPSWGAWPGPLLRAPPREVPLPLRARGVALLPTCTPQGDAWRGPKLPLTQPRAEPKARGGGPTRPTECSARVLGGGQEGEEAPARCSAGEGASLSSWAAISHAVHTPNLKGPWFPASERERASGLLFLMHTVKGREITVIHLLGAVGRRNLLSMCP